MLVCIFFFAQNSDLYYSGKFLDTKNQPQNFLKIQNKNTGISEVTDQEGFAIIAAKKYDTLVWNDGKNILVVPYVRELKEILESRIPKDQVQNIYSKSYDSLLLKDTADQFSFKKVDTKLAANSDSYFQKVRKLKAKNDTLFKLKSQPQMSLVFNGNFVTSVDAKSRNEIPQTQNRYVQGRSQNGSLVWKGPETNEIFSFGPDISTLGYDGQSYEYDLNGKLIPISSGLSSTKIYDNDIFRTVFSHRNQLNINAIFRKEYDEKLRLALDFGQERNQYYLKDQFDNTNNFKVKLSGKFLNFYLNSAFNYSQNKASNSNRIGLFTRAYQNSLLTPISFSNAQNVYLSTGEQRSYSQFADNPEFLFNQKNKYNYQSETKQYSFGIKRTWNHFNFNITQSLDEEKFLHNDIYKPSTYGFSNGFYNQRDQNNRFYNSNLITSYQFGNRLRSVFSFNHILNDQKINIQNSAGSKYMYQRTAQDYIFNYNLNFDKYNDFEIGANLGNAFYISNTATENKYWLPKANAYFTFDGIFNWNYAKFTVFGAYTDFTSEANMQKSYAGYATTIFSAQNYYQYFPIQEVQSFQNLKNIDAKEWKTGFRLNATRNLKFEAEYFNRKIVNDVFPTFEKNVLKLKNLADHTYSGYEFNFSYDNIFIADDFRSSHKISLFKYKDIVDRVDVGYNNFALSGFKDIYKTVSQGEVLGAVMGSYFERNPNGDLIIDDFGFPKKAAGLKIIADPTPDFVIKFTHQFTYKMLSLDINWEWKKGGKIWNGTQAVLDYYGRSQQSGDERNIKNFIFEGVNSNGNINTIPVDFYNQYLDISENRWSRYGYLGVAEDYVQKADYVRINGITLTANLNIGNFRRALGISFYVHNILLWQAKTGADPNQNLYDFDNGGGLDFFNLPSYKTFGCAVSFKF